LYGQQHGHHQGQYDDAYQHLSQGPQAGLPSGDYNKQLYGNPSMQGFAGSTQGNSTQQRVGQSPESAYKPYGAPATGAKDLNAGLAAQAPQGRGAGVAQGTGSGFYGNNRFGAGTPGANPAQGAAAQGPGAYSQSQDAGFYSYQPRQQQYWQ
jgi:hypothetical protein